MDSETEITGDSPGEDSLVGGSQRPEFRSRLSEHMGGCGASGRKEKRNVTMRIADLDRIDELTDGIREKTRKAFSRAGLIRHWLANEHLFSRPLLRRIESGKYSPAKLIAEVGPPAKEGRAGGAPTRTGYPFGLPDWKEVEEAAEAVTQDLKAWVAESARKGTVLGGPVRPCNCATIVRAAGRELAEGARIFTEGVARKACEIPPPNSGGGNSEGR